MKEAMKEAYLASEPIAMEKEKNNSDFTAFMTEEDRDMAENHYVTLRQDNMKLTEKNLKLTLLYEKNLKHLKNLKSIDQTSLVFRIRGGGRGRGGMMGAAGGGGDRTATTSRSYWTK